MPGSSFPQRPSLYECFKKLHESFLFENRAKKLILNRTIISVNSSPIFNLTFFPFLLSFNHAFLGATPLSSTFSSCFTLFAQSYCQQLDIWLFSEFLSARELSNEHLYADLGYF